MACHGDEIYALSLSHIDNRLDHRPFCHQESSLDTFLAKFPLQAAQVNFRAPPFPNTPIRLPASPDFIECKMGLSMS
jgi:hypothetical protein